MSVWLVILAAGVVTYGIRLSFIYLFGKLHIPADIQRSLRFVPPAVLSAILVPELFLHAGQLEITLSNDRLLAGIAAIAVGAWKKNTMLTIITGMAALLLLQFLP